MMNHKRGREVPQHVVDRRRREDEAPRLHAEVPHVLTLSLAIEERRPSGTIAARHVRRVVVQSAPALFVLPCGAPQCDGGVHEISFAVLRELRRGSATFEGETSCDRCDCALFHAGTATYG